MHLEETVDPFSFSCTYIQYCISCIKCTGIYAQECQPTYKRISSYFKCESRQWGFVIRFTCNFFIIFGVYPCYSTLINWRWKICNNCIEKVLHSLILNAEPQITGIANPVTVAFLNAVASSAGVIDS